MELPHQSTGRRFPMLLYHFKPYGLLRANGYTPHGHLGTPTLNMQPEAFLPL
jgi:hypothetical protein